MSTPKYVERFARLPAIFERLQRHPDGLSLETLAADFDVTVEALREELLAFYTADIGGRWLLTRPEVLEFLGPDGGTEDPGTAGVVRIVAEVPADIGVEYVDAGELGLAYTAALALLETEPDNEELSGAIDVLTETMFGPSAAADAPPAVQSWNRLLPTLRGALDDRRAVRINYSRAWHPGVTDREIEPYQLVQTRRGWEVDAGPVDDEGRLRTFLLSNIRSAEVLERTFTLPDDVAERLAEQRATTRVRVLLPQSARWVADFYAEQVTLVEDDEQDVVVDLDLLPPVERRVGRLLLAAGPLATVLAPADLDSAGVVLAEELMVHHSTTPAPDAEV
ncbi:proteasome accessory factor C [Nocardioides sp. J9]|uniref:WYL domain-containing protein n=1 Tax=Nocardioides sp. J9 TaxID=935844 RepID=UPI0011A77558|nr:WYL domain-containing protein [Nocardioides sp. J9]TWG97412.1 proteasome accessory factor C [Nocardioides sp. J9]